MLWRDRQTAKGYFGLSAMNKTKNFASLRFRAKMGSGSILMDLGNLRVGFPSLSHPPSPRLRRGMPGAREVLCSLRRCASPYVLLSASSYGSQSSACPMKLTQSQRSVFHWGPLFSLQTSTFYLQPNSL